MRKALNRRFLSIFPFSVNACTTKDLLFLVMVKCKRVEFASIKSEI